MDNRMNEIADNLLSAIREKYKGDYRNIPEILEFWHNTLFLFFSAANHQRLFGDSKVDYRRMVSFELMPDYLCGFYEANKTILDKIINSSLKSYIYEERDMNNDRQELLNVELDFTNDSLTLFSDKVSRDNTGSYYTPKEFAIQIINKAFQNKSFDKMKEYKIADLSCGGGDFLLAVMDYLQEELGIEKERSVCWLYGVDIDPIAIQICISNLLLFADQKDWKRIVSHFSFGNPLLISDVECTPEEKNKLFATRRLYAVGLGMPEAFFEDSFDVVVGNPPWKKIRFEERKFFRGISANISFVTQKSVRDKEVIKLKTTWPIVYNWRNDVCKEYSMMTAINYRHSKIKDSIAGELNTYALFTELAYNMLSPNGVLALVVKSTLVTAPVNQKLWKKFLDDKAVSSVFLFENKKKIFAIDSRERFIVFIAENRKSKSFDFAAGLTRPEELKRSCTIALNAEDLRRINPFTGTIPNVSDNGEIRFLKEAHNSFALFSDVYPDCHFGRLIHLTAHAANISRKQSKDNVPIYEGKFIEQYDARYATFHGMSDAKKYANKASAQNNEPDKMGVRPWPESRFFVDQSLWHKYLRQYGEKYSLCWRSLTSPTNRRTMLAMIVPTCPTCQSVQILQTKSLEELVMLLALFNSIPFDYFVRIKMPGLDLTQSVIKQIPVPSDSDYNEEYEINGVKTTLKKHILSYVISILQSEDRLDDLVLEFSNIVYEIKNKSIEQKKKMIDLLFQKAYHLDDNSFKNILLSFPKYQADHNV